MVSTTLLPSLLFAWNIDIKLEIVQPSCGYEAMSMRTSANGKDPGACSLALPPLLSLVFCFRNYKKWILKSLI